MGNLTGEKNLLTQHMVKSISDTLKEYVEEYPCSQLQVADVREVMAKIIDYLDIADVTGFNPWER
jgi:hypothetical protein